MLLREQQDSVKMDQWFIKQMAEDNTLAWTIRMMRIQVYTKGVQGE